MTTPAGGTAVAQTRRRDDPAAVASTLLADYDAVIFDCDGVLWKGDALVTPLVPLLLSELERHGKSVVFFTNNSLRSRSDYARKFAQFGLDVPADKIFSSSYAAAAYLSRRRQEEEAANEKKKKQKTEDDHEDAAAAKTPTTSCYVIGGRGILDELKLAGFHAFGGPEDDTKTADFATLGDGAEVTPDPNVKCVVVGVDPALNYMKIHYAAQCLMANENCLFIACNEDSRGHFTKNQEWPGAGASVAALAAVVGRPPDAVVGKPNTFMVREVMRRLGEEEEERGGKGGRPIRALMVGDRLDTDVAWAHAAADELEEEQQQAQRGEEAAGDGRRRLGALLVMSGVATDRDLEAWGGRPPEHVLPDVGPLALALAVLPT